MTERAHPLDSIVEALEKALTIGPHAACAAGTTSVAVYGSHEKKRLAAEQKVLAALQLARQMRESEPVAWRWTKIGAMGGRHPQLTMRNPCSDPDATDVVPLYALPLAPDAAEEVGGHG